MKGLPMIRAAFQLLLAAGLALPTLATAATVEYIHTDALGSPVAVTNSAGQVIERREYEPYGRQLAPAALTNGPGYTGHVTDALTGLTYMQQRYYDPGIGRFLSVDPVTPRAKPGANFNRYWYANNSPYRFIDPDGRRACGKSTTCQLAQGAGGGVLRVNSDGGERSPAQAAKIAHKITDAANGALKSIADKRFKSAGTAARAWSDRVRRVADKYDAEIASRLFYDGSSIALGTATSDGFRFEVNPDHSIGPSEFSITAGFVHTHPTSRLFSANDLNYVLDQYRSANGWVRSGAFEQSAFVSLPDGRVVGWKASSYMETEGGSYLNEDYYQEH